MFQWNPIREKGSAFRWSHCCTARLTSFVESVGCLSKSQDGFRKGRSTLNCVARLESYLASGRLSHLASIDARRAFDLVEPRLAMEYLTRIGVPSSLCDFLIQQLEGDSRVWTAYGWTDSTPIRRGTRQG